VSGRAKEIYRFSGGLPAASPTLSWDEPRKVILLAPGLLVRARSFGARTVFGLAQGLWGDSPGLLDVRNAYWAIRQVFGVIRRACGVIRGVYGAIRKGYGAIRGVYGAICKAYFPIRKL
jgi:hypothetical protein